MTATQKDLNVGEFKLLSQPRFSQYRIVDRLGRGGMGMVYKAEDTRLRRFVALKVLPGPTMLDDPRLIRFRQEARALSALNHPNICTIYDVGLERGHAFIAMEFLAGSTLHQRIAGRPMEIETVLSLAIEIAAGLEAAHSKGIIHRDIKPANIFVTESGSAKILDFGLAKMEQEALHSAAVDSSAPTASNDEPLTGPGSVLGTVGYMSPEQARGQVLDARTDLFSFGAVLYEMIAGVPPFAGETVASVFVALLNLDPLPLSRVKSQVPPGLENIVFKALEKDRDLRYRDAAGIRADLQRLKRELELGSTGVTQHGVASLSHQSTPIPRSSPTLAENRKVPVDPAASVLQKARSPWFLIPLVLAFLLAAAMNRNISLDKNRHSVPASTASIAVLPFTDLSPRGDQAYFSDGLSEELLHHLARVPGLKVAARSSAFQFKGRNEDVREVARKLGVANVLEGSVRREGNHMRITAALTKADDGFQLWSQTYDREINGIFTVQNEIATAVTQALQLKLLSHNGEPPSSNFRSASPEAYTAYLEAKFFSGRGQSKEDLGKALAYADRAITLDERYAPAWALRASVRNMMTQVSLFDPIVGSRNARVDAERAIALDPGLASAYMALATTQVYSDWDWKAAETSLDKAAALEPSNADVFRIRSYLSRVLGHLDEAIKLYEQAVALDPLRAASHVSQGYLLYVAGRYDEARAALQKGLELNPQSAYVHAHLAKILIYQGNPQQALAEIEKEPVEWQRLEGQVLAYHALGREQESDAVLATFIAKHQNDAAYQIAEVYAFRGESDKSFAWLERAYKQRDTGLPEIKTDPLLNNLRPDPRLNELLKKLQLPT